MTATPGGSFLHGIWQTSAGGCRDQRQCVANEQQCEHMYWLNPPFASTTVPTMSVTAPHMFTGCLQLIQFNKKLHIYGSYSYSYGYEYKQLIRVAVSVFFCEILHSFSGRMC